MGDEPFERDHAQRLSPQYIAKYRTLLDLRDGTRIPDEIMRGGARLFNLELIRNEFWFKRLRKLRTAGRGRQQAARTGAARAASEM